MQNNIVLQLIQTTPPVTRVLVFLTVTLSLLVYLDVVKPQQISYSRFYLQELQFYRIFTTFFYYGKTSFELVMNFVFLYKYSSVLEESYSRTSDYLFVILIIFTLLIITSSIFYIPFLATVLANTITYIWTRKNPLAIVQIFGFVSFSAFYLPFVFPIVSLVFDKSIAKDDIIGIFVGHLIFYFTEVYPKFGNRILKTPCVLHKLFKEECSACEKKKQGRKLMSFTRPATVRILEENSEVVPTVTVNDSQLENASKMETGNDASEEDKEERSYSNIESQSSQQENSDEIKEEELCCEGNNCCCEVEECFCEVEECCCEVDECYCEVDEVYCEVNECFYEVKHDDEDFESEEAAIVEIKQDDEDFESEEAAIVEIKQDDEDFESEEAAIVEIKQDDEDFESEEADFIEIKQENGTVEVKKGTNVIKPKPETAEVKGEESEDEFISQEVDTDAFISQEADELSKEDSVKSWESS